MKSIASFSFMAALATGGALPGIVAAQDSAGFSYELSVEIGVDSAVESDDPTAELDDFYATVEGEAELALAERIRVFGAFTFESLTDPTKDREFEDMGGYLNELGLAFDVGTAELRMGKISPAFGVAWDATPGYYGADFAEDYELAEMIGFNLDVPVAEAGSLSFALFYADNTALSNSLGYERGRTRKSAGGAGNTGKLDNIAVQWNGEIGATSYRAGLRYLSKGAGDVSDETGFVVGVNHAVSDSFGLLAEYATFDGYGGSDDNADYATLGAGYGVGDWAFSAAYTNRDISSAGRDHLYSLGADYDFGNGAELNFGYAFVDEGGVKSHSIAAAVVMTLGS